MPEEEELPNAKRQKLAHEPVDEKDAKKEAKLYLPLELRTEIWKYLVSDLIWSQSRGLSQPRAGFWELNKENFAVQEATVKPLQRLNVEESGQNVLFQLPLASDKRLLGEILYCTRHSFIYCFQSSKALHNFVELLQANHTFRFAATPHLHMELNFFRNLSQLMTWKNSSMAHGYEQNVRKYVVDWMDAVQKVPGLLRVDLILHHPWRDYRNLRHTLAPLRDRIRQQINVKLREQSWMRVPGEKKYHYTLTLAAIHGIRLKLELPEAIIRELAKFGCRGVRG